MRRAVRPPRAGPPACGALRGAAALAAAALLAGCGSSPAPNRVVQEPSPSPTATPDTRLTAQQLAGSVIVIRFHGTGLPGYVRRALRNERAAGVILFRDNVRSPSQVRRLARAARRAGGPGTIVCLDQEGGDVRILPWAPPERSAPRQAAAGTIGADSRAAARALARVGVTVNLAPVADVTTVSPSAMGGRVYGSRADEVAGRVAAAVRGYRTGGVAPTVKHFPGLGGSRENTDFRPATVRERPSTAPWRAAFRAGARFVMLSHARYPALDGTRIASQSRGIVTGLLREELGFDGVVMTDSMEAAAVRATGSLEQAGERSIRAGTDLLLTTGRGSYIRLRRHLGRRARADRALRRALERAVARIAAETR